MSIVLADGRRVKPDVVEWGLAIPGIGFKRVQRDTGDRRQPPGVGTVVSPQFEKRLPATIVKSALDSISNVEWRRGHSDLSSIEFLAKFRGIFPAYFFRDPTPQRCVAR